MKALLVLIGVLGASTAVAGSPTALFDAVVGVVAAESSEFETEEQLEREMERELGRRFSLLDTPECDARLAPDASVEEGPQVTALDCVIATAEHGAVLIEAQLRGARTVLELVDRSEDRLIEVYDPPGGLAWLQLTPTS